MSLGRSDPGRRSETIAAALSAGRLEALWMHGRRGSGTLSGFLPVSARWGRAWGRGGATAGCRWQAHRRTTAPTPFTTADNGPFPHPDRVLPSGYNGESNRWPVCRVRRDVCTPRRDAEEMRAAARNPEAGRGRHRRRIGAGRFRVGSRLSKPAFGPGRPPRGIPSSRRTVAARNPQQPCGSMSPGADIRRCFVRGTAHNFSGWLRFPFRATPWHSTPLPSIHGLSRIRP